MAAPDLHAHLMASVAHRTFSVLVNQGHFWDAPTGAKVFSRIFVNGVTTV
jgi:hypothetical protein